MKRFAIVILFLLLPSSILGNPRDVKDSEDLMREILEGKRGVREADLPPRYWFSVCFEFDGGDISLTSENNRRQLESIMKVINKELFQHASWKIKVHTDRAGSFEQNLELSQQRADRFLEIIKQGYKQKGKFTAIGVGEKETPGKNGVRNPEFRKIVVIWENP